MALVMVLSALTVLAVMLTEFQQETSAELGSVMSERDAVQAEYAARSAIALSRLLLAAEPTVRKPLSFLLQNAQIPVWLHADLILSAFNDEKSVRDFGALIGGQMERTKALGIPGASFEVEIVDEDSKINLNAAARGAGYKSQVAQQVLGLIGPPQYDKLFEGRDAEGNFNERPTVCSAIIDWTDTDTTNDSCLSTSQAQATEGGAEDSFYQMLKYPYERKNAAFDSLEELHRVRGISDDFWATFVDPDPDDPKSRIVTIWGSDKLNVNTSNAVATLAAVCAAVPVGQTTPVCNDMVTRSKAVSMLEMFRQLSAGIPVFHSVTQFTNMLKPAASATAAAGSAKPAASAPGMEPIVVDDVRRTSVAGNDGHTADYRARRCTFAKDTRRSKSGLQHICRRHRQERTSRNSNAYPHGRQPAWGTAAGHGATAGLLLINVWRRSADAERYEFRQRLRAAIGAVNGPTA